MTTPVQADGVGIDWSDPDAVRRAAGRLARWLPSAVAGARDVTVDRIEPPSGSGGFSNFGLIIDATWETAGTRSQNELFARVELPGDRLVHTADLGTEGRLLDAVWRAGTVPVPEVVAHETDHSVLGAPFLLMRRVAGRVMSDNPPFSAAGWVLDLDPAARARHYDNALRALAAVTTLDWEAAGLGFLRPPGPGTTSRERVDFVRDLLDTTAAGRDFPLHRAALELVEARCPAVAEPLALSWGDARLGNLLFDADTGEVNAVLDWEQAVIGSRELDLGWWLFSDRIYSDGFGLSLPPGFPDRAATIARFEELTGYTATHIDFYEAYAGVYIATIIAGIADRLVAAGVVPPEADMQNNNPSTIVLAGLLDLPMPRGASASWAD